MMTLIRDLMLAGSCAAIGCVPVQDIQPLPRAEQFNEEELSRYEGSRVRS